MTVSIAGTLILNSDILSFGEVRVENSGLIIPVPRDLMDPVYSCPTKSFLSRNGKVPTITSTHSNIQVLGTIDGVGRGFPANQGPGANSTLKDSQSDPSDIYGANHAGIGSVYSIPGTIEIVEEYHTVHNLNIIQCGIDLDYIPIGNIAVNVVNGPAQIEGKDFVLIDDFLSWEGLALESLISAGDVIRVIYVADTSRYFPAPKRTYGSYKAPTSVGSGSGEAFGGSGIRLVAPIGYINLTGTINASGENGSSKRTGGGSGGSVWLDAYTLKGGGSIYSEGGDASYVYAGGGGGGYIRLDYEKSNTFSGTLSVAGHKGGTHGIVTVEKKEPFFIDKFTGTILNTKWWSVLREPVELNNTVIMNTATEDLRNPRLESLFSLSGKDIRIECNFIPSGIEPSYHTSYFQMFIDDRNWVQVARKHNNIFGMYMVDGFLSQTAYPYTYAGVTFKIVKNDSTFNMQFSDETSDPVTIVSQVIPEFQNSVFKVALGTDKDENDATNYVTDYYKLNNIDEANGYVTLSSLPISAEDVALTIVEGSPQIYGTDFTVSGQRLYWIPPNLVLNEGDKIQIQYMEDSTYNNLQVSWDNFSIYSGIVSGIETSSPVVYVDPVNGNDSCNGTALAPLRNLFVATAWAKRGGTVVLYDGTHGPVEVLGKNLTIMGANGSKAVITTSVAQDTTGSNWENSCLTFKNCQGLVRNVILSGAKEAILARNVENFTVSYCTINNAQTGIKFTSYNKNCKIFGNTFCDTTTGVDFNLQSYNPVICSNVFCDSSTGVRLVDATNFIITSNTFNKLKNGIVVDNSSSGNIASNSLTNSTNGVVINDSSAGLFNNNFYGTVTWVSGSGYITDNSNNIAVQPGYVNQYLRNFRLLSFSGNRGAGTGIFDTEYIDRDGARRLDSSYDIGAYQYLNAPHTPGNYYVSSSGDDFYNSGNIDSPYRTLDKAMSVADSSVFVSRGHTDSYYLKLGNQSLGIDGTSVLLYSAIDGNFSNIDISRAVFVSSSGNDSSGNGTFEKPYRTISRALADSNSGANIVVISGEYLFFDGLANRVLVPFGDRTETFDSRMFIEDLFNTPYTMFPGHTVDQHNLWNINASGSSGCSSYEGYLRMSYDGTNPIAVTSAFSFNPVNGDTTAFEVTSELRQSIDPIYFSVFDASNNIFFRFFKGDYTCTLITNDETYNCWGSLVNPDSTSYFTEYVCITSTEVQNKYVNLSYLIQDPTDVAVNIIGGPSQELGSDFYVEDSRIRWDGKRLDGEIKEGDVLRVIYIARELSDPVKVRFILNNNVITVMGSVGNGYTKLMRKPLHSPVSSEWRISFYMNERSKPELSNGRGYVSKFAAIAESFSTDYAKPYKYKVWRQPVILHNT